MTKRPTSLSDIPAGLPILPFSGALLLPGAQRPLNIFEPRYITLIDKALATNRLVGLVQPKPGEKDSGELYDIGCLGRIIRFEEIADRRYFIVLEGIIRFHLKSETPDSEEFRQFGIDATQFISDFEPDIEMTKFSREKFIQIMRSYAEFAELDINWEEVHETSTADLINISSMLGPYGSEEKQVLLEAAGLSERGETLIAMAELEMARAQSETILQ